MNGGSGFALAIRPQEDHGSEYSLERGDKAPVLRPALLRAEDMNQISCFRIRVHVG
jgi:hypothetical protein